LNPLSAVYGQVTRFRRHWYEQHPQLQRRLGLPVVSVGNLVVGGSGKTPVVALLAETLRDAGLTPAIVSRGYKRRDTRRPVVVVSDGRSVLVGTGESGDEPQLLARRLPGVPVVIGANRYDAGMVARDRLGAGVLILDDGFQHLRLARTLDLLLLSRNDLAEGILPGGRLREPAEAARRADAVLAHGGAAEAAQLASRVGVARGFGMRVAYDALRLVTPFGGPVSQAPRRVVVMAAIARPQRFVAAVRELGYRVEQQITFRDHHWFTAADVERVQQVARDSGADAVLTTEKDAVRLEESAAGDVPFVFLPMDVRIEPADVFTRWLLDRLAPPQVGR
jgi:tetraacyldisaccharide 4'-kinase